MAEKSTGLYAYVSTGKSAGSTGPSTQLYSTLLIFLVWSTGPLLIIFGRPDGKLFLSPLPIIPWVVALLYSFRIIYSGKKYFVDPM